MPNFMWVKIAETTEDGTPVYYKDLGDLVFIAADAFGDPSVYNMVCLTKPQFDKLAKGIQGDSK